MTIKDATVLRIRQLCQEKNIRINELANRAGVTPSSVYSMLDSRRREVTLNLVMKLCDGLDVSIPVFFNSVLFSDLDCEV